MNPKNISGPFETGVPSSIFIQSSPGQVISTASRKASDGNMSWPTTLCAA